MGLLSRMLRLWKADMHGILEQLEDKELLMKQHLREMETILLHNEARSNQLVEVIHGIQQELAGRMEEIGRIEQDLDWAVRMGKDDFARPLIRKQRAQQVACSHLQRQFSSLEEEKNELARIIGDQRRQYDQLKIKTAGFRRKTELQRLNEVWGMRVDPVGFGPIADEVVELELMRRKEASSRGGER